MNKLVVFLALLVSIKSFGLEEKYNKGIINKITPTAEMLEVDGAFDIDSYTNLPDTEKYKSATIYYPTTKTTLLSGVAIVPGFRETQEHIKWWGPRLASHGFVVITVSTNESEAQPPERAKVLMSAIEALNEENKRQGSPLAGRIDSNRMAVMGHSMGGGGALLAANQHNDKIMAAIPFASWQPNSDYSNIKVPTLVIAASSDKWAPVHLHAWSHYQTIPKSTTKAYLEFKGGNHFIGNTNKSNLNVHGVLGRYVISWLKLYVEGDEHYRGFIYGERKISDIDKFSSFITNSNDD